MELLKENKDLTIPSEFESAPEGGVKWLRTNEDLISFSRQEVDNYFTGILNGLKKGDFPLFVNGYYTTIKCRFQHRLNIRSSFPWFSEDNYTMTNIGWTNFYHPKLMPGYKEMSITTSAQVAQKSVTNGIKHSHFRQGMYYDENINGSDGDKYRCAIISIYDMPLGALKTKEVILKNKDLCRVHEYEDYERYFVLSFIPQISEIHNRGGDMLHFSFPIGYISKIERACKENKKNEDQQRYAYIVSLVKADPTFFPRLFHTFIPEAFTDDVLLYQSAPNNYWAGTFPGRIQVQIPELRRLGMTQDIQYNGK